MARAGGDAEFYISYFQQPGRAEAEIEPDVRGWLHGIDSFSTTMPGLVSSYLLPGCGHWVPEERPDHVNEILIDWLHQMHPATA